MGASDQHAAPRGDGIGTAASQASSSLDQGGDVGVARSILANSAYSAGADLASKAATVAFWVLMARKLGDEAFGTFTFSLALAAIVTTLANFGQDRILTREIARDHGQLRRYFWNTVGLRVAVSAPVLAGAIAVGAALGSDGRTLIVLAFLGIAVVAELLTKTCFASYQAFERMVYVPVVLIPQRVALAVAGITALLLGASVVAVAAVYAVVAVLGFPFALALLARRVADPGFEFDVRRWPALMRAALPVGLAGVFGIVLFRIDTVILGWFEPAEVVGEYGAAYRLFESTFFVSWSVGAAVYPILSRTSRTTIPPLGRVFERSLKLLVALTMPFAVGAAVFARPALDGLYGAEYGDAHIALALLAPAIVLFPVSYIAGYVLVGQNRERQSTIAYGFVMVENVLANLVLIPLFSLEGAAASTSISAILLTLVLVRFALNASGPVDWVRIAAGPALAGAAAAAAFVVLRDSPIAAIAVAAAAYLATLLVFEHVVFPGDARLVRSFLRRRLA
jgi:O-antigen/teichoic acid export membrane protein